MASSGRRHAVCAVWFLASAVILGLLAPNAHAFSVPSLPGLSAFTGSAPQTTGSAKLTSLVSHRRSPLVAPTGVAGIGMKAVRNPTLIGSPIPRTWTEGTEFIRDGRNIRAGDVVIIRRSDGRSPRHLCAVPRGPSGCA